MNTQSRYVRVPQNATAHELAMSVADRLNGPALAAWLLCVASTDSFTALRCAAKQLGVVCVIGAPAVRVSQ